MTEKEKAKNQDPCNPYKGWLDSLPKMSPAPSTGDPKGVPSTTEFKFCNLVLQGGGLHGVALTGFIKKLEESNVRFAGIAGASAGAITAMGMVGARNSVFDTSADSLLQLLKDMPAREFMDGPKNIRALIENILRNGSPFDFRNIPSLLESWSRLKARRGLNPGNHFESWLERALKSRFQLKNINDLFDRLEFHRNQCVTGGFGNRIGFPQERERMLKLTAAALPIGLKFEFPQDVKAVKLNRDSTSPARLVRTSMSIPYFFEPVRFDLAPNEWRAMLDSYATHLLHDEALARAAEYQQLTFVDGGVFSNLPLYAFLDENTDAAGDVMPTLAVTLIEHDPERPDQSPTPKFRRSGGAMMREIVNTISAIKAQRDRDAFISLQRPGAQNRVLLWSIDLTGHNWLNFAATHSEIMEMYDKGYKSGEKFIAEVS